jgi:hypothetical protein
VESLHHYDDVCAERASIIPKREQRSRLFLVA